MNFVKKNSFLIISMVCLILISGCGKKTKKPVIEPAPAEKTEETKKWDGDMTPPDQWVCEQVDDLETIYFDYDKSILKQNSRDMIEKNAEWLKENDDELVRVEGHCDERGTEEYNIALGERRAESVKKYYIALGIEEKRIAVLSWGEEKPVDQRGNEDAWSRNRRAETLIRVR